MEKTFLLALFSIILSTTLYAQANNTECGCPVNQFTDVNAEAVFSFSNDRAIAVCGYKNTDDTHPTYSEFVLAVCGENKVIDFWDATTVCRLTSHNDTLFVQELYPLPIADNFEFEETVWTTEKIYFTDNKVNRKKSVNSGIRKYSAAEIQEVLETYRNAGSGFDESKMKIANQLFVAALSGSKQAWRSFTEFKDRFDVPDGAYSQEYRVLKEMLAQWEAQEGNVPVPIVFV